MAETGNNYPGFEGKVGRTREESVPWWPAVKSAKKGSPNIVVIYMDDMGYSDLGCYGSEIATPNIDALAQRGQRFNHYTTHPICSPARAALLTGRNAHSVATGWLVNNNPGFPGYSGEIPKEAVTLPETFRAAGYATIGIGKWHNSPNSATPNDSWPSQRGFDRFYGFLEGETSYFFPARIVHNTTVAPIDSYPKDYYATDDWTEKAISYVREVRNDRPHQPFLLYLAYNAVHGPLQAKDVDLAKYRGKYEAGWDVLREQRLAKQKALGLVPSHTQLSPRDPDVKPWSEVPAAERALYVRHMETYAAMLDCVDQNVGALMAAIAELGELDNTIVVFSADNGGTSSAGPTGNVNFNRRFAGLKPLPVATDIARSEWIGSGRANPLYPMGWGQVSNTPFPSYKTYTGGGGRRVSLIVSWPEKIKRTGIVSDQFAHVTDIMPTLIDLAGISPVATVQSKPSLPLHGVSLAGVLTKEEASLRTEQYYECWANRAYYRDGWITVSLQNRGAAINFDAWTLHHQASDFSESLDLSKEHPEKLAELVEAFDKAAWSNMVYPLDNRTPIQKFNQLAPHQRPPASSIRRFVPGGQTVNRALIIPLIADRSFKISVRVKQPKNGEGVLFALGDVAGGFVMSVEQGELRLFYNGFGEWTHMMPLAMPEGDVTLALEYEALGQRAGRGRLLHEGGATGVWEGLSPTLMGGFHEGLDIGLDRRAPVDWDLFERKGAFPYSGKILDLTIESGPAAPQSAYGGG